MLKKDIGKVAKAMVTEEKSRYYFNDVFAEELRTIVRKDAVPGIGIDVQQIYMSDTPCIAVQFVPNRNLEMQELQTITHHLRIQFRRHLTKKSCRWRHFATYETDSEYVRVFIYYEEFPEDRENINRRYREVVREKRGVDFGCLKDDDLDRQLKNV